MKTVIVVLLILVIGILIFTFYPNKESKKPKGTGVAQPDIKEPKTKEGDVVQ